MNNVRLFCGNLGSNETGSETISEPIEISEVSLDAGMIIIQPIEMNQAEIDTGAGNEEVINIEVNSPTIESSTEAEVTPSRKKRKR